eukprot:scaffold1010_cov334-Prasinococcus_capsulatus_cf.AAC.1
MHERYCGKATRLPQARRSRYCRPDRLPAQRGRSQLACSAGAVVGVSHTGTHAPVGLPPTRGGCCFFHLAEP